MPGLLFHQGFDRPDHFGIAGSIRPTGPCFVELAWIGHADRAAISRSSDEMKTVHACAIKVAFRVKARRFILERIAGNLNTPQILHPDPAVGWAPHPESNWKPQIHSCRQKRDSTAQRSDSRCVSGSMPAPSFPGMTHLSVRWACDAHHHRQWCREPPETSGPCSASICSMVI